MSDKHESQQGKKKQNKKVPVGTKSSPWYLEPAHVQNGKKIDAYYWKVTPSGVWKMVEVPKNSVIRHQTSY